MALHRNVYSFVYRGEDTPETNNVIWIHHQKKNDLQSPIVAEIWIKNEWRPLIFGTYADGLAECCCCGSPFVREEGENSAVARAASNTARGKYAFVLGYSSHALRDNSIAIGNNLVTDADGQIVLGQFNERSADDRFIIGIGDSDLNRKNAIKITKNGSIVFYNNSDNEYYSLSQILDSIGSGEVISGNLVKLGDLVEIVPDV